MNSIKTLLPHEYPKLLQRVEDLPDEMYLRGTLPPDHLTFLTIVGARKRSEYGERVCRELVAALRGLPVVIISGLAYGIDSIAHEAALENGILTIAVPGSSIAEGEVYPAAHHDLARRILESGGALFTPFKETILGNRWTFPYRNRIMAGMAHATLVIESTAKSGTLITSAYAHDLNRDVLTVPGSIYAPLSEGPHHLLRHGATPIRHAADLLEALGFEPATPRQRPLLDDLSNDEQLVFDTLELPLSRDALIERLGIGPARTNASVSLLELKGAVEEILGEIRRL
jgi:DNA processing protein